VIEVVGIGEDGWAGLTTAARAALADAQVVLGSPRQLALVAGHVARTECWPAPMAPALAALAGRPERIAVLASGDPLLHGVGASLVRLHGPGALRVHPHLSSVTLACARLGWPVADVEVVSLIARPVSVLLSHLAGGRRLLVLTSGDAAEIAVSLTGAGFGASTMTVLARLGGPAETVAAGRADTWPGAEHDPLAVVAIDCRGEGRSRLAGLPDASYDSDGALTKAEVRAVTLAALGPRPGELLWDLGAGSGSVAIEWMRAHPACRAVAVEARQVRADRIVRNAESLGVPGLAVVSGTAPAALADLPRPDAVFLGGGITSPGIVEAVLAAQPSRLVANVVTVEGESLLAHLAGEHGGSLTRIAVSRAEPVGGFTAYKPAIAVTQWRLAL
jgi:precorrin-6Y C5,15-methyltransferase (decarboxylating)